MPSAQFIFLCFARLCVLAAFFGGGIYLLLHEHGTAGGWLLFFSVIYGGFAFDTVSKKSRIVDSTDAKADEDSR